MLSVVKAGVVLASALLSLGQCDDDAHTSAPSVKCDKTTNNCIVLQNQKVLQEPDGFRNVMFGCWGSKGVYVTSRGDTVGDNSASTPTSSSLTIVLNDPDCLPATATR